MGISQYRLAKDIYIPLRRIHEIVKVKHSTTEDTTARLGRYFKISFQFRTNLQSHYNLKSALVRIDNRLKSKVKIFM